VVGLVGVVVEVEEVGGSGNRRLLEVVEAVVMAVMEEEAGQSARWTVRVWRRTVGI
jgi:hypothetical protein